MKMLKTTITCGLLLTALLFSCKKQDGYSDEVQTNVNTTAVDSAGSSADTSGVNSAGPAGKSAVGGAGDKGAGNTGAESINAGNKESGGNEAKGTGTGSGPGPSAKDGSAYAGPSDPSNFVKDTLKKGKKKKVN
jgi:hypothetical protein